MKTYKNKSYLQYMRIGDDWCMSPTLVSHNCRGAELPDTTWNHTSRYDTPLACYGCGAQAPALLEETFRMVLKLTGNTPSKGLRSPFSIHLGLPGAKERYENENENENENISS